MGVLFLIIGSNIVMQLLCPNSDKIQYLNDAISVSYVIFGLLLLLLFLRWSLCMRPEIKISHYNLNSYSLWGNMLSSIEISLKRNIQLNVGEGRKEGNVLFNDALNAFYLRLYGVGHMVKYHSDSERKPAAAT